MGFELDVQSLLGHRGDFRIVGKNIMSKEVHNKSAIIELKGTNSVHIQQNFPDKSDVKNILI